MILMRKNALNICLLAFGVAIFPALTFAMYIAFQLYGPSSNITKTVTVLDGLSTLISVPSLIILGVLFPKYPSIFGAYCQNHRILTMILILIFGLVIVPLLAKSFGYQQKHSSVTCGMLATNCVAIQTASTDVGAYIRRANAFKGHSGSGFL